MAVASPHQFEFTQVTGQEERPHRGGIYLDHVTRRKAPAVQVAYSGPLPIDMATVVYPYPDPGKPASVEVTRLPVATRGTNAPAVEALALRIELRRRARGESVQDHLLLGPKSGEAESGEIRLVGEALLLRRTADGNWTRILMKRGTRVSENGRLLLEVDQPVASVCAWRGGERLRLEAPGVKQARLYAPGITAVRWDGQEASFAREADWVSVRRLTE